MKFKGVRILVQQPKDKATWLSKKLELPLVEEDGNYIVRMKDCDVIFSHTDTPVVIQEGQEGYYVGLAHLALRSTNLKQSVSLCEEKDVELTNGKDISYNPQIWGPGMDYVNPVCGDGYGLEICQRLDLPEKDMTTLTDGLEHIGIPVRNLEESIDWYKGLGFEVGTKVLNHRESDGADIYCAMLVGDGIILETYEFLHMDHEPFTNQAFHSLVFTDATERILEGPNKEIIEVVKE